MSVFKDRESFLEACKEGDLDTVRFLVEMVDYTYKSRGLSLAKLGSHDDIVYFLNNWGVK